MGRHSAPDDVDIDGVSAETGTDGGSGVATAVDDRPTGRHAQPDSDLPPTAADEWRAGETMRPRPGPDEPTVHEQSTNVTSDGVGLALLDDALVEPEDVGTDEHPPGDEHPRDLVVEPPPGPMVIVDAETSEAVILAPVDAPLAPDPPLAPLALDAPSRGVARPPGAHATRQDASLVRRHGDIRARAAAAVLAPFVVYVVVLAVLGKLEVHYLIWVWAPAITAGVLVGLVLDAGHRRYPGPPPSDSAAAPDIAAAPDTEPAPHTEPAPGPPPDEVSARPGPG